MFQTIYSIHFLCGVEYCYFPTKRIKLFYLSIEEIKYPTRNCSNVAIVVLLVSFHRHLEAFYFSRIISFALSSFSRLSIILTLVTSESA